MVVACVEAVKCIQRDVIDDDGCKMVLERRFKVRKVVGTSWNVAPAPPKCTLSH